MNGGDLFPAAAPGPCRQFVVEAPPGPARRQRLADWRAACEAAGATAHLLSCDFAVAGPWAGLADLLRAIVPAVRRERPELVERHAGELTLVLPTLRREVDVSNPTLTDVASPEEKVRNYPTDRAYRIVHGLVELLSAWSAHRRAAPWVLACDHFEEAGALVRMFFRELMRRRGEELGLTLILAVAPGEAGRLDLAPVETVSLAWDLPPDPEPAADPAEMGRLARELEARVGGDYLEMSEALPRLVYYYRHSDAPDKGLAWQGYAFGEYNHYGLYEDALRYAGPVLADLDGILSATDMFTRWNLVGSIANCYLALNQPEKALAIVEAEGLAKVEDPLDRSGVFYVLALIHSRFLPKPDFRQAEEYIASGLAALEQADIEPSRKYFMWVFLHNGLAYIRHRQGKPEEAIELCRSGFELLERHLSPDQHRLHRSVLLYNMAQVYSALREPDKAVEYFSAAMRYDPNYSEYYNERGSAYLSLGRLEEAVADYREAIRLSAPYQEAWTNLGQAYKLMGRFPEAVEAYSRALDLDPRQVLPRLGRAQSHDALGQAEEALADYTAALEGDPSQPLALANRACLLYAAGDLPGALADLDRAVALSPDNPDLLFNRSVALAELGRGGEALRDLRRCLELAPENESREEIESRIAWLSAAGREPAGAAQAASPA